MKNALLIAALMLALGVPARAFEQDITSYGDFCPMCSNYGSGKDRVTHSEAMARMNEYFMQKGLTIGNPRGMGRFIKADVFRRGKLVDRIIFDRRTGRVRSIY